MKKVLLILSVLSVLVAYRAYIVVNRPLPDGIIQPNSVRILDELGRLANFLFKTCITLDVNPASQPIKFLVNKGFSLIMNGVYRPNKDVQITNTKIANVPVKIIRPATQNKPLPVIIYMHGGGWTWFSTDTYSSYLENMANRTRMVVIAIDYRKAPQYPFPVGYQDCVNVTWQVIVGKSGANINTQKVLVAGDGSGGNLAAAVARHFPRKVMIQILINPILQMMDFQTPSHRDNMDLIPGITSSETEISHWLLYLGQPQTFLNSMKQNKHIYPSTVSSHFNLIDSDKHLPKYLKLTNKTTTIPKEHDLVVAKRLESHIINDTLSPMMHRNLGGVPKAYVITSQYDVLRDEAVMYTNRLHEDGTRVKLKHYKDTFHGFFLFSHESGMFQLDEAKMALQEMVEFLNAKVHGRAAPIREVYNA